MKLLIRDYLAKLRESEELDVLVADLLLNMQIEPLSKPQRGVRQDGVDIAAVGTDPDDHERKLFLITIKAGDVTRSDWDGNSLNAVRPSLNEIKDVYLSQRVDSSHRDLPKKIVLCCGGVLKQNVDALWKGYTEPNGQPEQPEYDLWTGDKLALLIEEYFLDEYLFPSENQSLMRKALALLDQNEQEPVFFYQLVDQILFESGLPTSKSQRSHAKHLKALRLVNLCLGVVAKWSLDVGNTRPALLCAERALLRTWDFLRDLDFLGKEPVKEAYGQLYLQYLAAAHAYAERIQPLCIMRDGLANLKFHAEVEVLEYPLRTFEAIGFLSTLGMNRALAFDATGWKVHEESAHFVSLTLAELIKNNPAAITPLYDGHSIEVALGLLLLFKTNLIAEALAWLHALWDRVVFAYHFNDHVPVLSDSYEDLLDLKFGRAAPKEKLMSLSTLLATIAEWYALLGRQDDYAVFRDTVHKACGEVNLQLWYPDEATESALFRENAGRDTGAMCTSIFLPENIEILRARMLMRLKDQTAFFQLSCVTRGFPALGLVASRHFRTPVIPAYWQQLVPQSNDTSDTQDPSETDEAGNDLPNYQAKADRPITDPAM